MSDRDYLGSLEEVTLLAVQRLGEDAYGVTIFEELVEAKRHISIGSLYITLSRLEDKGMIKSRVGESTPERGGRPKKFFKITGAGAHALNEAEQTRRYLYQARREGAL